MKWVQLLMYNKFDPSISKVVGHVTLPNYRGIGTHGLVFFMLASIAHCWKQVFAYYLENKVNGSNFISVILEIMKRAEEIRLHVHGIISDMELANWTI